VAFLKETLYEALSLVI